MRQSAGVPATRGKYWFKSMSFQAAVWWRASVDRHTVPQVEQPLFRLYYFTYAGGNAFAANRFAPELPEGVEIIAFESPARLPDGATRYLHWEALIEDFGNALLDDVGDVPFVLYGHSFGGMCAWLMACWLRNRVGPKPLHLFVSSKQCPLLHEPYNLFAALTAAQRRQFFVSRFGPELPPALLADAVVLDDVLADFAIDATCQSSFWPAQCLFPDFLEPLDIPLTLFHGELDRYLSNAEEFEKWRDVTTGPFKRIMLVGAGHNLLSQGGRTEEIMREIRGVIEPVVERAREQRREASAAQ